LAAIIIINNNNGCNTLIELGSYYKNTNRAMKKAILLILPIIVFIFSCKKENDELNSSSIYGKWKLTSSCGGVVGCSPASNNYIITIEVTEKEVVEQTINSQSKASEYYKKSNYSIINMEILDSKVSYNLRFEDGALYEIEVSKGALVLQEDNFEKTYKKL
jgi:hypothetical protein